MIVKLNLFTLRHEESISKEKQNHDELKGTLPSYGHFVLLLLKNTPVSDHKHELTFMQVIAISSAQKFM